MVLTSGIGVVGTGRFLFGSKRGPSELAAEEWLGVLFVPLVPRRSLTLAIEATHDDSLRAALRSSGRLSSSEIGNRYASSLAGLVGAALVAAMIYMSSSNTGLLGGLLVVCGGAALVALGGYLDWRHPRVARPTR